MRARANRLRRCGSSRNFANTSAPSGVCARTGEAASRAPTKIAAFIGRSLRFSSEAFQAPAHELRRHGVFWVDMIPAKKCFGKALAARMPWPQGAMIAVGHDDPSRASFRGERKPRNNFLICGLVLEVQLSPLEKMTLVPGSPDPAYATGAPFLAGHRDDGDLVARFTDWLVQPARVRIAGLFVSTPQFTALPFLSFTSR